MRRRNSKRPARRERFVNEPHDSDQACPPFGTGVTDPFHLYLKQVVTLHRAMFEKLLFQEPAVAPELASLFAETGRIYLEIAADLERRYGASDRILNNILKPES
jgi:hypothetical protein